MKSTNITYWIVTGIFGAFMMFSAIPDILVLQPAIDFLAKIGYPAYIIPFLGWAKALGVIAIVIPGYPRIKEWAYAGLFFDLAGATYSVTAVEGFSAGTLFMILPFSLLFISYALYHKRRRVAGKAG